jgi:hypothetical protein
MMKADFRRFLWYVWLKVLYLPQPTRVQYDIAEFLATGPRRRMVQAFRGVGKSYITAAYVVWRLWRNPDEKVMVVSASEDFAKEISGFIRKILFSCPFLAELKPKADQRDNIQSFDVGLAGPSKSPSVKAVGITGQLTGSRASIILFDDTEIPRNSATENQREKLAKLTGEAADVLIPGGEVLYLGTPQSIQSIYRHLPSKGYTVRVWPARYPKKEDLPKFDGQLAPLLMKDMEEDPSLQTPLPGSDSGGAPTDPKRFTHQELLEKEAEKGRSEFTLQYQLDTRLADADKYPLRLRDLIIMDVDREVAPAKVVWASGPDQRIKDYENIGLDGDGWFAPMYTSDQFEPYHGSVLYIDPSGRGKDETTYCVTKMLHGTVYVRRWGGIQDGYSETTLETLAKIAKDEKVNLIRVEENFGSGMFSALLQPVLNRIHPCQIEDYRVSGQKETRIIGKLEPALSSHRVVMDRSIIAASLRGDTANVYDGFYQLTRLTRDRASLKHDDRIEILAEAVAHWQELLKVDQERAERLAKDRAMDAEVRRFLTGAGVSLRAGTGRSFTNTKRSR